MLKKIFFHGASVTQQNGESSFFYQLEKIVGKEDYFSLSKKGYGGCQLDNAGFITIDADTNVDMDMCVLEWNTIGSSIFNEAILKHIVVTLLKKNIIPIFLILARNSPSDQKLKVLCEDKIISFCKANNLFFLDYRSLIVPSEDLRDDVHTNINGALKYAQSLSVDLKMISNKISADFSFPVLGQSQYTISSIRELNYKFSEGTTKKLCFSNVTKDAQVILEITRGPSSGIIEVNFGQRKIQIWDRWSHYERQGFITISSESLDTLDSSGCISLTVLADKIDYSKCQRVFSYDGIKELKINGIFGINCIPSRLF
jgi:hypothetical protein